MNKRNTFRLASLSAVLMMAAVAHAAPVLYSNGPVVNLTGISVLTPPDNIYGFGAQTSFQNTVADDFKVGSGETWNISSISLFSYQTGATAFPFTSVNWQIVAGDLNTGTVLASGTGAATNEGLVGYRVLNTSLNNQQRPVYRIGLDIPDLVLTSGDYWLTWSIGGTLASGPWVPPIANDRSPNAMQRLGNTGLFVELLDTASQRPVELPFQLNGTVPEPTSLALVLAAGLAAGAVSRRRKA